MDTHIGIFFEQIPHPCAKSDKFIWRFAISIGKFRANIYLVGPQSRHKEHEAKEVVFIAVVFRNDIFKPKPVRACFAVSHEGIRHFPHGRRAPHLCKYFIISQKLRRLCIILYAVAENADVAYFAHRIAKIHISFDNGGFSTINGKPWASNHLVFVGKFLKSL